MGRKQAWGIRGKSMCLGMRTFVNGGGEKKNGPKRTGLKKRGKENSKSKESKLQKRAWLRRLGKSVGGRERK